MAGRNIEDKIRCSFCGKSQEQVRKMIAGPNGAFICDECVEVCTEIIEEEFEEEENVQPEGMAEGKRMALPNAEIMIHQPSGGAKGQATEIQIAAENILKTKKKLNEIIAANTGKPIEQVAQDTERDYYMSAEEAKEYGIIDSIITNR